MIYDSVLWWLKLNLWEEIWGNPKHWAYLHCIFHQVKEKPEWVSSSKLQKTPQKNNLLNFKPWKVYADVSVKAVRSYFCRISTLTNHFLRRARLWTQQIKSNSPRLFLYGGRIFIFLGFKRNLLEFCSSSLSTFLKIEETLKHFTKKCKTHLVAELNGAIAQYVFYLLINPRRLFPLKTWNRWYAKDMREERLLLSAWFFLLTTTSLFIHF